jgi:hypothetical protein
MKQTIVLLIFGALLAHLLSSYATGAATNGQGNLTGATGASGCTCHTSTSAIGTTVELDSAGVLVTSYRGGGSYTIKISATNNTTHTNLSHFGFQVSSVKATGAGTTAAALAGTWGTLPANTHITATSSCDVVEQSEALTATTGTGVAGTTYIESIPWTAPVAGTGSVKLYGVINAVNDNGQDNGDYYQVASAVTITETAVVTLVASVNISETSGTNPACAGSSVTFTAVPANGGTTPAYQWKVNGATVSGATASTYTTTTLVTGSIITCVMTSNLSGVSGSPATSNAITMTINPIVIPTLSIATNNTTICSGSSVTFTATPANGGAMPAYDWKINGMPAGGTGATYTTTTLANSDVVSCTMISDAACASPANVTSNSITMTVNPTVTPSVSIVTNNTTICAGAGATFTATPVNGGNAPAYQWQVNGGDVGTNSATFTSTTLANNAIVTCILTSDAACASPASATSNSLTMSVYPPATPAVTISTTTTSVCPGSSVTFTATPVNGGTPSYQWKVNGANAGTNSPAFTTTTLANNAVVTCVMTSTALCLTTATATSNALTMSVASQTPAITIAPSSASICSGAADTFTAQATNGGASPSYQWKVNGAVEGTNSATFITSALAPGAVVTSTLTSSLSCASPTTATATATSVTVNTIVQPTISITASGDSVCAGTAVVYIASGTNLGSTPTYQWMVNSVHAGSDSSHFTSALAGSSVIGCIVTSSAVCASPQQVSSNSITTAILSSPVVTISPSGALILCLGDSLLLTATGATSYHWTNGDTTSAIYVHLTDTFGVTGTNGVCAAVAAVPAIVAVHTPSVPVVAQHNNILTSTTEAGYQWLLNGSALPGDTLQSLTITQSGYYTVTTIDAGGCAASSTTDTFTYVDGIIGVNGNIGIRLYPIPNQGSFIIETATNNSTLCIYDVYGQKVYEQQLTSDRTQIDDANLASAIYFVRVWNGSSTETIRMQVLKE